MTKQVPYLQKIHVIHAPSGVNIWSSPNSQSKNPQLISGMLSALFTFFEEEVGGNVIQINLMDGVLVIRDYLDLKIILEMSNFSHPAVQEALMEEFILRITNVISSPSREINSYVNAIENSDLRNLLQLETQEQILTKRGLVNFFDDSLIIIEQGQKMQGYSAGKNFAGSIATVIDSLQTLFHEVRFRADSDNHTNYILREDLISIPGHSCLATSFPTVTASESDIHVYLLHPSLTGGGLSAVASLLLDFFNSNFEIVRSLKSPLCFYVPLIEESSELNKDFEHHLAVGFNLLRPVINELCESLLFGLPVAIVSDPFSQEEILRVLDFIIPEDYLKKQIEVLEELPERFQGNKIMFLPRKELNSVVELCKNYVEIGNYMTASLPRSQYLEKEITISSEIPILDIISFYRSVMKDIERSVRELVLLTSGVYPLDDSVAMYSEFMERIRDRNYAKFVEKVFSSRFWPSRARLQELKRIYNRRRKESFQEGFQRIKSSVQEKIWNMSFNAPSKR